MNSVTYSCSTERPFQHSSFIKNLITSPESPTPAKSIEKDGEAPAIYAFQQSGKNRFNKKLRSKYRN